ncbi:MAG: hypothetical protein JST11_12655 [Acidobacteria bacterium]|nr:hypothetical protein [Acidobacteriota bacterium]
MITFTLEAILAIFLVIILMRLFRKEPKPAEPAYQAPVEDLANLKVGDARTGDVLSIAGAGDQMSDLDFTVDRASRLEAGARTWVEFSGPYKERRVAVRVGGDEDEEAEVYLHSSPARVTLDDVGLSEQDLADIDERQNPADNFEYDNTSWNYRLSREVRASRETPPQQTSYYYWEFLTPDAARLLSIRKAEGEPFAVTVYQRIQPVDVTVYRGART